MPQLATFVTLSPIPGLARWIDGQAPAALASTQDLRGYAARYLVEAKRPDGAPLDSVARFHLANGAIVHDVHADADLSENGLRQSRGAMVNYRYDRKRLEPNIEAYFGARRVAVSRAIEALLKNARGRRAGKG